MKQKRELIERIIIYCGYDELNDVSKLISKNGGTIVDREVTAWIGDKEKPIEYKVTAERLIKEQERVAKPGIGFAGPNPASLTQITKVE